MRGRGSGAGNREIIKERNCENFSCNSDFLQVTFAQINQPMHETTKCYDLKNGSRGGGRRHVTSCQEGRIVQWRNRKARSAN